MTQYKRQKTSNTMGNHGENGNGNGSEMPTDECFTQIRSMLKHSTSFGNETGTFPMATFEPGTKGWDNLRRARILVVGAGGLGCEMLKDLALSGFRDIHVIDLDTVDLTNLNRQFLFRMNDVGKPKAEVAARFVENRVPGVSVQPYVGKIQDRGLEWYRQFDLIIAGLDNIEARRWLNVALCNFIETDDDGEIASIEAYHNRILNPQAPVQCDGDGNEKVDNAFIPLIDGGTEGFKGQTRVIFPCATPCFECALDTFPPQTGYAMCTITETPRQPEHCVAYVMEVEWHKEFPNRKYDADRADDMRWIYERALARAEQYGISGVTYMLTLGVVKNIIPAVASTNALIAATCVNEAFKLITLAGQTLDNFYLFIGDAENGAFGTREQVGRKPIGGCLACRQLRKTLTVKSDKTLSEVIDEEMRENADLQLSDPSIMKAGKALYTPRPPDAKKKTKPNLEKKIGDLVEQGEEFIVTDKMFPSGVSLSVTFRLE